LYGIIGIIEVGEVEPNQFVSAQVGIILQKLIS
jgi:hypothetical protein